MELNKRILDCEVRKKADSRIVEFVASDESRDSYGTVIKADGWDLERFNRNGVIGYQHNIYGDNLCLAPNPDDVIGKGTARIEDRKLIVAVEFEPASINEMAEKIYQKLMFGSLRAVSVGFCAIEGNYGEGIEAKGAENQTYYYTRAELYEVSVVNIPANANALKRSVRDSTFGAIKYVYNLLNRKFSLSEIGDMTINQIMREIDNPEKRSIEQESQLTNGYSTFTTTTLKLVTEDKPNIEEKLSIDNNEDKIIIASAELALSTTK